MILCALGYHLLNSNKIDHIIEQTAIETSVALVALSSIPLIGTLLTSAWTAYNNSRLQDVIDNISKQLLQLGEEKLDKEYITSEEFIDLFNLALKIRIQHRSTQKAKFIYGLIVETSSKARSFAFSASLKESFLHCLNQLSDEELHFLYEFSQDKFHQKSRDAIYQISDQHGIAVDGLISNGILRIDGAWQQAIALTMLGREFIAYMKKLAYTDV